MAATSAEAAASVKAAASATTMPATSMLCQGRAGEAGNCYRRYQNQH
jgi:hypothetical protein